MRYATVPVTLPGAGFPMHEDYYGFSEKPFSLTPDPKYLYMSQSHASAFDLLQYAIRRREGFVVVTGEIGTGKTTLCRALLEQLDRTTFTALVLNPFLSEEDLLRQILQDFGVVSRHEVTRGYLASVGKSRLIETLNEFLLSLLPLGAGALLIIDEAQNLPLQVLEQIRILSNLETNKTKLLQIVLVGQRNLQDRLRSKELRQLDQRVSIRYELTPLSRDETAAYVAHRLTIAGGRTAVSFTPRALDIVHRTTRGIPRLVNLLCDRALLGGYGARTTRITPDIVSAAAATLSLDVPRRPRAAALRQRVTPFLAGAAAMALLALGAYGLLRSDDGRASAEALTTAPAPRAAPQLAEPVPPAAPSPVESPQATTGTAAPNVVVAGDREPRFSVLVGSFRQVSEAEVLSAQLRNDGYTVWTRRAIAGGGTWHQVLAGPYAAIELARQDEARIRLRPGYADARVVAR